MKQLVKINKDLETIIRSQLEYEDILLKRIDTEKFVSNRLFDKWFDQEQIITDWRYSYWKLERKFAKALEDIKFLNHYINQKEIKKGKNGKKKK